MHSIVNHYSARYAIINHYNIVYAKDVGANTGRIATPMSEDNPHRRLPR